jgi:hypothetical protein
MTPIESAIKNRIKEAFAFRVSQPLWENITTKIQNASKLSDAIKNWCSNLEKEDFQEKIHYIPQKNEQPETGSNDSSSQILTCMEGSTAEIPNVEGLYLQVDWEKKQ